MTKKKLITTKVFGNLIIKTVMKELSIEEKAKAYDDAKARMSIAYNSNRCTIGFMNEIFPELKESEDEKMMRKILALIEWSKSFAASGITSDEAKEMTAWLEKQCEHANFRNKIQIGDKVTRNQDGMLVNLSQLNRVAKDEKQGGQKPADKVEPKFKVGDWVIDEFGSIGKIDTIINNKYIVRGISGRLLQHAEHIEENNLHLWTIQEAKDGDVLACKNGWTCIFKTLINDETFGSYCFMDNTKWFCETGSECHTLKEEFVKVYNGKIYPATKEQRDLLFQKMKEAGYEWDAEKKELRKIEQKLDKVEPKFKVGDKVKSIIDGFECTIESIDNTCYYGDTTNFDIQDQDGWELVEQKPAWSEEDEKMVERCLQLICESDYNLSDKVDLEFWLKSLRPQSTWKPSDEQMKALNTFIMQGEISYVGQGTELQSLYNELKKLAE